MSSPEQYHNNHNSEPQPVTPEQAAHDRIHAGLDVAEAFLDRLSESGISSAESGLDMLYVSPRLRDSNTSGSKWPFITSDGVTVPNSVRIGAYDDVWQIHIGRVNGSLITAFSSVPSSYINMNTAGTTTAIEQVVIVRDDSGDVTINEQGVAEGIIDDAPKGGLDVTGRPTRESLDKRFGQLMAEISRAEASPLIRDLKQFEVSEQHADIVKKAQEIGKLVHGG